MLLTKFFCLIIIVFPSIYWCCDAREEEKDADNQLRRLWVIKNDDNHVSLYQGGDHFFKLPASHSSKLRKIKPKKKYRSVCVDENNHKVKGPWKKGRKHCKRIKRYWFFKPEEKKPKYTDMKRSKGLRKSQVRHAMQDENLKKYVKSTNKKKIESFGKHHRKSDKYNKYITKSFLSSVGIETVESNTIFDTLNTTNVTFNTFIEVCMNSSDIIEQHLRRIVGRPKNRTYWYLTGKKECLETLVNENQTRKSIKNPKYHLESTWFCKKIKTNMIACKSRKNRKYLLKWKVSGNTKIVRHKNSSPVEKTNGEDASKMDKRNMITGNRIRSIWLRSSNLTLVNNSRGNVGSPIESKIAEDDTNMNITPSLESTMAPLLKLSPLIDFDNTTVDQNALLTEIEKTTTPTLKETVSEIINREENNSSRLKIHTPNKTHKKRLNKTWVLRHDYKDLLTSVTRRSEGHVTKINPKKIIEKRMNLKDDGTDILPAYSGVPRRSVGRQHTIRNQKSWLKKRNSKIPGTRIRKIWFVKDHNVNKSPILLSFQRRFHRFKKARNKNIDKYFQRHHIDQTQRNTKKIPDERLQTTWFLRDDDRNYLSTFPSSPGRSYGHRKNNYRAMGAKKAKRVKKMLGNRLKNAWFQKNEYKDVLPTVHTEIKDKPLCANCEGSAITTNPKKTRKKPIKKTWLLEHAPWQSDITDDDKSLSRYKSKQREITRAFKIPSNRIIQNQQGKDKKLLNETTNLFSTQTFYNDTLENRMRKIWFAKSGKMNNPISRFLPEQKTTKNRRYDFSRKKQYSPKKNKTKLQPLDKMRVTWFVKGKVEKPPHLTRTWTLAANDISENSTIELSNKPGLITKRKHHPGRRTWLLDENGIASSPVGFGKEIPLSIRNLLSSKKHFSDKFQPLETRKTTSSVNENGTDKKFKFKISSRKHLKNNPNLQPLERRKLNWYVYHNKTENVPIIFRYIIQDGPDKNYLTERSQLEDKNSGKPSLTAHRKNFINKSKSQPVERRKTTWFMKRNSKNKFLYSVRNTDRKKFKSKLQPVQRKKTTWFVNRNGNDKSPYSVRNSLSVEPFSNFSRKHLNPHNRLKGTWFLGRNAKQNTPQQLTNRVLTKPKQTFNKKPRPRPMDKRKITWFVEEDEQDNFPDSQLSLNPAEIANRNNFKVKSKSQPVERRKTTWFANRNGNDKSPYSVRNSLSVEPFSNFSRKHLNPHNRLKGTWFLGRNAKQNTPIQLTNRILTKPNQTLSKKPRPRPMDRRKTTWFVEEDKQDNFPDSQLSLNPAEIANRNNFKVKTKSQPVERRKTTWFANRNGNDKSPYSVRNSLSMEPFSNFSRKHLNPHNRLKGTWFLGRTAKQNTPIQLTNRVLTKPNQTFSKKPRPRPMDRRKTTWFMEEDEQDNFPDSQLSLNPAEIANRNNFKVKTKSQPVERRKTTWFANRNGNDKSPYSGRNSLSVEPFSNFSRKHLNPHNRLKGIWFLGRNAKQNTPQQLTNRVLTKPNRTFNKKSRPRPTDKRKITWFVEEDEQDNFDDSQRNLLSLNPAEIANRNNFKFKSKSQLVERGKKTWFMKGNRKDKPLYSVRNSLTVEQSGNSSRKDLNGKLELNSLDRLKKLHFLSRNSPVRKRIHIEPNKIVKPSLIFGKTYLKDKLQPTDRRKKTWFMNGNKKDKSLYLVRNSLTVEQSGNSSRKDLNDKLELNSVNRLKKLHFLSRNSPVRNRIHIEQKKIVKPSPIFSKTYLKDKLQPTDKRKKTWFMKGNKKDKPLYSVRNSLTVEQSGNSSRKDLNGKLELNSVNRLKKLHFLSRKSPVGNRIHIEPKNIVKPSSIFSKKYVKDKFQPTDRRKTTWFINGNKTDKPLYLVRNSLTVEQSGNSSRKDLNGKLELNSLDRLKKLHFLSRNSPVRNRIHIEPNKIVKPSSIFSKKYVKDKFQPTDRRKKTWFMNGNKKDKSLYLVRNSLTVKQSGNSSRKDLNGKLELNSLDRLKKLHFLSRNSPVRNRIHIEPNKIVKPSSIFRKKYVKDKFQPTDRRKKTWFMNGNKKDKSLYLVRNSLTVEQSGNSSRKDLNGKLELNSLDRLKKLHFLSRNSPVRNRIHIEPNKIVKPSSIFSKKYLKDKFQPTDRRKKTWFMEENEQDKSPYSERSLLSPNALQITNRKNLKVKSKLKPRATTWFKQGKVHGKSRHSNQTSSRKSLKNKLKSQHEKRRQSTWFARKKGQGKTSYSVRNLLSVEPSKITNRILVKDESKMRGEKRRKKTWFAKNKIRDTSHYSVRNQLPVQLPKITNRILVKDESKMPHEKRRKKTWFIKNKEDTTHFSSRNLLSVQLPKITNRIAVKNQSKMQNRKRGRKIWFAQNKGHRFLFSDRNLLSVEPSTVTYRNQLEDKPKFQHTKRRKRTWFAQNKGKDKSSYSARNLLTVHSSEVTYRNRLEDKSKFQHTKRRKRTWFAQNKGKDKSSYSARNLLTVHPSEVTYRNRLEDKSKFQHTKRRKRTWFAQSKGKDKSFYSARNLLTVHPSEVTYRNQLEDKSNFRHVKRGKRTWFAKNNRRGKSSHFSRNLVSALPHQTGRVQNFTNKLKKNINKKTTPYVSSSKNVDRLKSTWFARGQEKSPYIVRSLMSAEQSLSDNSKKSSSKRKLTTWTHKVKKPQKLSKRRWKNEAHHVRIIAKQGKPEMFAKKKKIALQKTWYSEDHDLSNRNLLNDRSKENLRIKERKIIPMKKLKLTWFRKAHRNKYLSDKEKSVSFYNRNKIFSFLRNPRKHKANFKNGLLKRRFLTTTADYNEFKDEDKNVEIPRKQHNSKPKHARSTRLRVTWLRKGY